MAFLIDSDVLIDATRGIRPAALYLDGIKGAWSISQVSVLELLVGARNQREQNAIQAFLAAQRTEPLSNGIGELASLLIRQYGMSNGLHVFDSLIAATAMQLRLTLVSRNVKHFAPISGLDFQSPGYDPRSAGGA